jgi:hypothetical protein
MGISPRQIGWPTRTNTLWRISKALQRAIKVASHPTTTSTTTAP